VDALSLSTAAARGSLTTLVAQAFRFAIQVGALVVLSRVLTPSDFGLIAMVTTIIGVASLVGDFGLSLAVLRSREVSRGERTNLFWWNVAVGTLCGAAVFCAAPLVSEFYHVSELTGLTRWLSVVFLLNGATAQFRAEIARSMAYMRLAVVDVMAQLIGLVSALVVVFNGGSYWALATQQISIALSTLCIASFLSGWFPGLPRRDTSVRRFLTFGARTVGVQLVTYIGSNVDSIVLGRMWGANVLGIYNRAYQVFTMPINQLAAPMTNVALPVLSRVANAARLQSFLERAQIIISYSLFFLFAVLAAVAPPLFAALFGEGWEGVGSVVRILCLGGIFQSLSFVYYWIFLNANKVGLHLRLVAISRSVMVCLVVVGAHWGATGVAFATALGLCGIWLSLTIFGIGHCGISARGLVRVSVRPLVVFLAVAVVGIGVSLFVLDQAYFEQVFWILLGCIITLSGGIAISRGVRSDISLLHTTVAMAFQGAR
jgi:O-antigen/teichoic acid export membrane protein